LIPLRFPSPARFADFRSLLVYHGFTAEQVTKRTGAPTIYAFQSRGHGRPEGVGLDSGLDVLIRLFMDAEPVPVEVVEDLLGAGTLELMDDLGLLRPGEGRKEAEGSVILYPTAGPWVVSDRMDTPEPDPERDGYTLDVVYPAITRSVMVFLSTLPTRRCGTFLELCSGTGIAALIAGADFADEAVAVDITERSTVFARFNIALNEMDNVTALQGDLWEPVAGRTFDCIAAHPPYMAARRTKFIYRDGGEDGEQITRRILAGASVHLAPGGVLHCTCMLTDRKGTKLGERVREMLGPDSEHLDLLVLENNRVDPWSHLTSRLGKAVGEQVAETVEQIQAFREMGVEAMVFSTIVVRHNGGAHPPLTMVHSRGPQTGWPQVEWALEMGARLADPGRGAAWLAASFPRLSPHARLHIRYRGAPGAEDPWEAEGGYIQVTYPFVKGGDTTLAVARFLGRCDGETPIEAHMERMQRDGEVPADFPPEHFLEMVKGLVELGVLEVGDLPVPPPPPQRPGGRVMD
jgi:methylase of polypeptide subunit release factors